ncbi:MAG: amino acid decarboxylase [Ruminococcaceae bacterium]|nr:amino acid decarboxylase [Oscillospiraceae bacterium]
MTTPICEFVRRYAQQDALRLHMPGHKGSGPLGVESLDLTEIDGADSLFEADGIIRESEENAGRLFGADTYYSTEGSSLAIRAMLMLAVRYAKSQARPPLIAAGRNAHKTFLTAAALLDFPLRWLPQKESDGYLSCRVTADDVEAFLKASPTLPVAVYLTSPDYLGNTVDVASIAEVCHRFGVLLLIDNAHGAYLKFLNPSRHPIDLGADACADSAHKTLSALTGSAYLHLSHRAPSAFCIGAKEALATFASTSPSYLILQSLDALNRTLDEGYSHRLQEFGRLANDAKARLCRNGYVFCGNEPLKWTVDAKKRGYLGTELAELLRRTGIVCEFADRDYLVLMLTPEIGTLGLERLETALDAIPSRAVIREQPPRPTVGRAVMSVREAMLSPFEQVSPKEAVGRILASPSVSCPPAVPIVVSGELIDENAVKAFSYYGIESCSVVKEP